MPNGDELTKEFAELSKEFETPFSHIQEFFPGYKAQLTGLAKMMYAGQERLTSATKEYEVYLDWQTKYESSQFWTGFSLAYQPWRLGEYRRFIAARKAGFDIPPPIKAEFDESSAAYARSAWTMNITQAMPYLLADPESGISSAEDILTMFPSLHITDVDRGYASTLFDKLAFLIPPSAEEPIAKTPEELLKFLTSGAEAKLELAGVHKLSVDELIKSFREPLPELPIGMTGEDVRSLMTDLAYSEEEIDNIDSIRGAAESLTAAWVEESAQLELMRTGILEAEIPELSPGQWAKLIAFQPAMGALEILEGYFNALPRPLAAWFVMNVPLIRETPWAKEMRSITEEYKFLGEDSWAAYSRAFVESEANWALKLFTEMVFDPTTYIGFGIATKITKPIPYVGKFVGAIERGWLEMWDIPFKGLRTGLRAIPKTPGQAGFSKARAFYVDFKALLERGTGKPLLRGVTNDEVARIGKEAMDFAIENPQIASATIHGRVGMQLLEHDFIDAAKITSWIKRLGVAGEEVTQQTVHNVNDAWFRLFRKANNLDEVSNEMLGLLGAQSTKKTAARMANILSSEMDDVVAKAIVRLEAPTAKGALDNAFTELRLVTERQLRSPQYKFARNVGRITSWSRMVERGVMSRLGQTIDRRITAPMANQYLLFMNYGPMNVVESGMRSFLGGGEILYPKTINPVDEIMMLGKYLANVPYEFHEAVARLEMAIVVPSTGQTMYREGVIPYITKAGPKGSFTIRVGGKPFTINSLQKAMIDLPGEIGLRQRAWYLVGKYKQILGDMAPNETKAIATIVDDASARLTGLTSMSKKEVRGLVKQVYHASLVDPGEVRALNVPIKQLESQKALYGINKTLDQCTEIQSIFKESIRGEVRSGKVWTDIDGYIDRVVASAKEFNISELEGQTRVLKNLVKDFTDNPPRDSFEFMRQMKEISDLTSGIGGRISDVRVTARARASQLTAAERGAFHEGNWTEIQRFIDEVDTSLNQIIDNLEGIATTGKLEYPTITGYRGGAFRKTTGITATEGEGLYISKSRSVAEGFGDVSEVRYMEPQNPLKLRTDDELPALMVTPWLDEPIKVTDSAWMRLNKQARIDVGLPPKAPLTAKFNKRLNELLRGEGYDGVVVPKGPSPTDEFMVLLDEKLWKDIPKATMLTDVQREQALSLLANQRIKLNTLLSTRTTERTIISDWMARKPKFKTTEEGVAWWNSLDSARSEPWNKYWDIQETLLEQEYMLREGLTSTMQDIVSIPPVEVIDRLTPSHIAALWGGTGDDLSKSLIKAETMTLIGRRQFIAETRAKAARVAKNIGKTSADDIGFNKEAVGQVYDQILSQQGLDPRLAEPLTPMLKQFEEIRHELHHVYATKKIPATDYDAISGFLGKVSDDLAGLDIYRPAVEPMVGMPESWGAFESHVRGLSLEAREALEPTMKFFRGYSRLAAGVAPDELVDGLFRFVVDNEAGLYSRAFEKSVAKAGRNPTRANKVIAIDNYAQLQHEIEAVTEFGRLLRSVQDDLAAGRIITVEAPAAIELRALHKHPARVKGLRQVTSEEVEDYLKRLQKLAGTEAPKEVPNLMEATRAFREGDLGAAGVAADTALSKMHKLYRIHHPEFELVPPKPPAVATERWMNLKDDAMLKAREKYMLDFTDYSEHNMVDAAMRMIFPFWTYEWQRYMWLPRAFLRTPGLGTGIGRYMNYSDSGYIPVPGTDIQFNPLRGTVFMGGFRRLYMRDFPEYYDAFPGMEIIDYISRFGFYPGFHVMLPIIATGAATGKPEWGELAPAWVKTGFDALLAVSPDSVAKNLSEQIFPDRYRSYLTILTLIEDGQDGVAIWDKIEANTATEEEEKLWGKAVKKASGLKGILMEQTGLFRLRPPEFTEFMESSKKLKEELLGVPVEVQDIINRRYPVTGMRVSDYYHLDPLQQKIMYEIEQYERWSGIISPLMPSTWQEEDRRIREYWEAVENINAKARETGFLDEQGNMEIPPVTELNSLLVSGAISPEQWISMRGEALGRASAAISELKQEVYPDVPVTMDEREARFAERGIPAPTYHPGQEMLWLYYEQAPRWTWNWEAERYEWDFNTYYGAIDVIMKSLPEPYKQRFIDTIMFNWTPMEQLYWTINRDFLRPYRLARELIMKTLSPEERAVIKRYEVAKGAERQALMDVLHPSGDKLVSWYSSQLRDVHETMRKLDPELDAWLAFWGVTDKILTTSAQETYDGLRARFLTPEMVR